MLQRVSGSNRPRNSLIVACLAPHIGKGRLVVFDGAENGKIVIRFAHNTLLLRCVIKVEMIFGVHS